MIKKFLIIILSFYFLALLQSSFFVQFNINGFFPNLILITVILLNFLENPKKNSGIFSALLGGFFLDVFSQKPIGFHILILIFLAISIKFILKRYLEPVIRLSPWINFLRIKK